MNKTLSLIVTLAIFLLSGSAWSQNDQRLVIEPENPDSNDLITISITNSACYFMSEVRQEQDRRVDIILTFSVQQCPNESDFKTTIRPLDIGDYTVVYSQSLGGRTLGLVDKIEFSVVEARPVSGLADGGINGLYYNPEADGHYLYILETDFTTLVVWTTFDADGKQAWVYGTGELENGKSVIADTYINRNGGYSINGEIVESEVEHWGWLEVDMTSCLAGSVAFHSDLPEFGSGQFPIERLAFVKQMGCIGID